MRTTFSLRFPGLDEATSRGLARECFDRIDLLESRLSRFIEGSDISRINALSAGETVRISEECHRCLLAALEGHRLTHGRFDVSMGRKIRAQKLGEPFQETGTGQLLIHPDAAAVSCLTPGLELDLGGIGKGFALDLLAEMLAEWEVTDALLCAGASSMLAIGPTAWPILLQGDGGSLPCTLQDRALSASGTGVQGEHIVRPSGIEPSAGPTPSRVWVFDDTATRAEIGSTAWMLDAIDDPNASDSVAGAQRGDAYLDTPEGIMGPRLLPWQRE